MRLCLLLLVLLAAPAWGEVRIETDAGLQRAAERALGERPGTVLVLRRDRVLAVTRPSEAFARAFPPGSVMKVVTAAALLESRAVSRTERVVCTNRVEIGGRAYSCGYPGGHGAVEMRRALEQSCSVYFWAMGQRVSDAAVMRAARLLGVTSADGAPWPRGSAGLLDLSGSRRRRTLALVGEGDGVRMSPWQAAVMTSRVAGLSPCGLRADTLRFLREALRGAVARGTGKPAAVAGLTVSGKTGTAEWRPGDPSDTCGWFAGWSRNTVVVVYLEHGQGREAAGMAAKVLREAVR